MSALVPAADAAIARIDKARTLLAEAKSMIEVKQVIDMAAAAEVYAKRQKLSDEAIGYAHSIKIDALTRLGEMLKAGPKHEGGRPAQKTGSVVEPVSSPPTLAELGIDKKVSMVAQQLANLPDDMRQAVAKREATISQARKQVSEKQRADDLARPTETVLPVGIHRGDFRELAHMIPDDSVELVFTDPPYDEDSVELYEAAAKEAACLVREGYARRRSKRPARRCARRPREVRARMAAVAGRGRILHSRALQRRRSRRRLLPRRWHDGGGVRGDWPTVHRVRG